MDDYNFTNEEKQRIDVLYGNGFVDITPEDAALIGRWESYKAIKKSEHQATLKAIEEQMQETMLTTRLEHEQAMSNLQELQARALERLERIEDGI